MVCYWWDYHVKSFFFFFIYWRLLPKANLSYKRSNFHFLLKVAEKQTSLKQQKYSMQILGHAQSKLWLELIVSWAIYVHLPNCQYVNLPICQSANLPLCQFTNLIICQSANLIICQSSNQPICQFGCTMCGKAEGVSWWMESLGKSKAQNPRGHRPPRGLAIYHDTPTAFPQFFILSSSRTS